MLLYIILIFAIHIIIYKILETYILKPIKTINVVSYEFKNIVSLFPNINKKIYKAINPSVFTLNNTTYTTFRLTANHYLSLHKIKTWILGNNADYESKIVIISENSKSEVITPNIKDISEYDEITKGKTYLHTGYEDARPVVINNKIYLTVCTLANHVLHTQLGLIKLLETEIEKPIILANQFKLLDPSRNKTNGQKNWMPFIYQNELYYVFSVNPHLILKCNPETGRNLQHSITYPNLNEDIRGGSNIITYNHPDFGMVYLALTHVRRYMFYTHQLYIFESISPFKIISITKEFYFESDKIKILNPRYKNYLKFFWNVQFGSGILCDGNMIYLYYGHNNSKSIKIGLQSDILHTMLTKI